MSRIEELMMIEDEIKGNLILEYIDSIKLNKVKFGYTENIVIDNFNYSFERKNLFIYGKNGSGKSQY